MKAAVFILLPNTTSSKALQNKLIGFYYWVKANAMQSLQVLAFLYLKFHYAKHVILRLMKTYILHKH